jgi:heme oxygenase
VTTQPRRGVLGSAAVSAGAGLLPLEALRERTRQVHQDLDDALTAPLGRVVDPPGYLRLLTTLSSLHAHTDAPLGAWVRATPWVRNRLDPALLPRRSDLYASDLAALGRPDRVARPRAEVCDDARGLGYLYVVAGSSKGARVVLHQLPDGVGADARRGLGDAADAGARLWRDCRQVLTTPQPEGLVARAADEAARLFEVLLGALRPGERPGEGVA